MISRTDIEDMTDAQDELSDAIGLILSATPEGDPWRASSFGTYPLDCTPTDEAIATILNAVVSGDLARPSQAGMSEWQDISTAPNPKELGPIQMLCAHAERGWIRMGRFYPEMNRWYYSGTNERSQWSQVEGDEPTHWMPLPPAPPAAMKDGG